MTEQEFVKKCLEEICKKNGFAKSSDMVQRDFELVSDEINEKTGTLISISTIKRLLRGSFSRTPQIATLNAISNYLGFKNWQEYKTSLMDAALSLPAGKNGNSVNTIKKKYFITPALKWKWIGLIAIIFGTLLMLSFFRFGSTPPSHFEKAQFSAKKTTNNAIPNTVIFSYNVDDVVADSFFIQQSWDVNRRVRVSKNSHTLTDIYYEPGYHTARLMANDSIIKTFDVSIPTHDWFFVAKNTSPRSIPDYIKPGNFIKNGCLALNKKDLDSNGIKTDEEKSFVYTYFPEKIHVNSDNYILKTRIRMKTVKNNFCPYIMCEVYCQRNFMYFINTPKGCVSEASVQFGENFLSGKNTDLSSLGADINQWMDIELRVQNRQVKILLDSKPIFSASYNNPSGLITGLGFISNGLCEVDFADLRALDGTVIYNNDFENGHN